MLKKIFIFLCLNLCIINTYAKSISPYEYLNKEKVAFANSFSNEHQIEVLIFVSFLCPYCYKFNQLLQTHTFNKNINIVKVPVSYNNPDYEYFAKLYYTLEELELLENLENKVYAAIHEEQIDLHKKHILNKFLKSNNIDIHKFYKVFNSFGINIRVKIADNLGKKYDIDGTPFVSIAGLYKLNGTYSQQIKSIKIISQKILKEKEKNFLESALKKYFDINLKNKNLIK